MVDLVFSAILVVCIGGLIYTTLKMRQLRKFSDYLDKEIERIFSTNEWRTNALDIEASYANYRSSAAWNYKFESMVVYRGR